MMLPLRGTMLLLLLLMKRLMLYSDRSRATASVACVTR